MIKGSAAADFGQYLLLPSEKEELTRNNPTLSKIIHPYVGSLELIRGEKRFCIYIPDAQLKEYAECPEIYSRIKKVQVERLKSKKEAKREWAKRPHLFMEDRYVNSSSFVVPRVSSENRDYIPIGYIVDGNTIISDSAFAVYDAASSVFGIITSKLHMIWVKTIGGYLGTSIRYSATLCYNTFPFPKISAEKKAEIEAAAEEVLITREYYPEKTLAELYDPDKMPQDLREAHAKLDDIVESCYPGYPFASDEARLECLFKLYEKMTASTSHLTAAKK